MFRRALAVALIVGIAGPASGQSWFQQRDDGFYVGGGLGGTSLKLDTSGLIGSKKETDIGWKLFAGYQINRYAAVEAGYYDLGKASFNGQFAVAIPPILAGTPTSVSLRSDAFALSAVGNLPLANSGFALVGRLGVAHAKSHADVTVGLTGGTISENSTELTYGLGLRYNFTPEIAVRAEWERFRVGGSNVGGKSDVDLFSLNALYRF
jgi:OOP family OmpA-OmpF porin